MADPIIHTIKPDVYTTTPDKGFFTLPAGASNWFHSTGHFYKTGGGGDENKLITHDSVNFESRYDGDYSNGSAGGNPCSSSGFEVYFKSNTNTPGFLTAVIATGSRTNLSRWRSSSISGDDQSNCMRNVVGCTFVSDNTSSDDSNSPKIYIHNMAFLYRSTSGSPSVYTLKQPLEGVKHWNTSHRRDRIYQGGQLNSNQNIDGKTFHGIIIEYWTVKNTGSTPRGYSHKIQNLKFMISGDRRSNPSTATNRSDDFIILQRGNNKHTQDQIIYTR